MHQLSSMWDRCVIYSVQLPLFAVGNVNMFFLQAGINLDSTQTGHHVCLRVWIKIGKPQCAFGNCENIPAGLLVQNAEPVDEG